MNLIGNCCISNYLLRLWGFGNTNPFTWIHLDYNSFYNLLTLYDSINWENYELDRKPHPWHKNNYLFYINIDNKIKINYLHFLFDKNANIPIIKEHDVYYNKIWEYIIEKYIKYKNLMLTKNKPPMFILEWEQLDFNETTFYKMLKLDLKYKVVVITYNKKFKNINKKNLLIIYDPHGRSVGYKGAGYRNPQWYAKTYNKKIKEFLEK